VAYTSVASTSYSLQSADIEAKEGDKYKVKVRQFPVFKQGRTQAKLSIDGLVLDHGAYCALRLRTQWDGKVNNWSFSDFEETMKDGNICSRPFTFGKIKTTSEFNVGLGLEVSKTSAYRPAPTADASAEELSSKPLDDYCTIRVELKRWKRMGEKRHEKVEKAKKTSKIRRVKAPVPSIVHEDSKPASFGMCTE
jgi:hypothetical protein